MINMTSNFVFFLLGDNPGPEFLYTDVSEHSVPSAQVMQTRRIAENQPNIQRTN